MDSVLIVSDEKIESLSKLLTDSGAANVQYVKDISQANEFFLSNKADYVIMPGEKFVGAVEIVADNQKELDSLKIQNQKLQEKLDEIRLVNRAKCVLIQYLNMTEQQAHRYIEKQSMDLRQSRIVTAEAILKTYEI